MFHSRGTAGSYISPWSYQRPLPPVLWKCSLLLPWGSLSSIFLIKVTLTTINTSPLSFVLSLSITKLKTTCMSSLESVCSGQLPVFFMCYLLTRLFGFRMYHEQWLSKCTAWNCPLLPLGEDPSLCRFFFSLCLWFLVLKTPTFVLLLELWGEQKNSEQCGATFLSYSAFSWVLGLALNLLSIWYYLCVWYEIVSYFFSLSVGDQTSQNYSWKKLFFLCCVVFEPVSKSTGHECVPPHLDFLSVPLSASIRPILVFSIK